MINSTVLQGRLVRDPETRHTQSGIEVCSFTVAWSKKINETETKLFLDCTAWRAIAKFISQYFRKGQEIVVAGELSTRQWEDREGHKRSSTELTVREASFCGPKAETSASPAQGGYTTPAAGGNTAAPSTHSDFSELDEDDSDLPF